MAADNDPPGPIPGGSFFVKSVSVDDSTPVGGWSFKLQTLDLKLFGVERDAWKSQRQALDFSQQLAARGGWYHSFRLPGGRLIDGHLSLEELERRAAWLPVPDDLRGQRVLDVGAWDGWFSFEMERRGAAVLALDCVDVENFRLIHRALGSRVDYRVADFQRIAPGELGRFDIVLFLSVLYHLKHPLLALEKVCALADGVAIVSSFITDAPGRSPEEMARAAPQMEFYESDELGGQFDNWFGPNAACVMALCRAAGFARVEMIAVDGSSAWFACYRRWPAPLADDEPRIADSLSAPQSAIEPPVLEDAVHGRNYGINFDSAGDDTISCWFRPAAGAGAPRSREDVWPEVDAYGVPCVYLGSQPNGRWQCNFRLPPGLDAGWHSVSLRVAGGRGSNARRIAVDLPVRADALRIEGACDAFTSEPGVVRHRAAKGGERAAASGPRPGGGEPDMIVSIWVRGLPENADRANVSVFLAAREDQAAPAGAATRKAAPAGAVTRKAAPSGVAPHEAALGNGGCRLRVESVSPADGGLTQVNARVPLAVSRAIAGAPGPHVCALRVVCGGAESAPLPLCVEP